MTALDVFIVNVALSQIGSDVGSPALGNLSWILNAYAIVFAALLVPAGRLGDRYGNKQVFLFGLGVFSFASLGCALSSSLWLIVGLRCLQAVGGAALVPTSLGLLLNAMPRERRASSVIWWSVSSNLGGAAGPLLGGLLTSVSWRWIFLINVPIGVVAGAAALLFVPNIRHDTQTRAPDLLGGLLLVLGSASLTLALTEGPTWGWQSGRTLAAFSLFAAAVPSFVLRSGHHEAPVVDLSLFRERVFASANAAIFLAFAAFGIQLLAMVLWLERVWHYSPVHAGALIAPGPAMVAITGLGIRRLITKLPDGPIAATGALLQAGGGLLIGASVVATHPNYVADVLPGWLIIGIGAGLTIPTIIAAGTAGLPHHRASTGSAILQMARWIGSSLGVAALVVILGRPTTVASHDRYTKAWWGAAIIAGLAAAAALLLTPRLKPIPIQDEVPLDSF